MSDEPLFDPEEPRESSILASGEDHALRDVVGRLVAEQPYAILCTQGGGQPYGSLVALAVSDALDWAVFSTAITTRKYRLLADCDHVALVFDSRSRSMDDMMQVEAVTVTGRARRVPPGAGFEQVAALLVGRHPQLGGFVRVPTTALFRVEIIRYFYVTRFQEVRQWTPNRG